MTLKIRKPLILVIFTTFGWAALVGCAPSAGARTPQSTSEIELPTRPSDTVNITAREMIFENDERISYCEILENQTNSYTGIRDTQLEPIASLSKVITSAWAIATYGMDYRFESEWYLNPVAGKPGVFDAYLRTNYDPIVNSEKLVYFLSELNTLGVKSLRKLTIDESTRVYLSVLSQPHVELEKVPVTSDESKENLKLVFNSKNWAKRTLKARDNVQAWAAKQQKAMVIPSSFSVEQVVVQSSAEINKDAYTIKKIIPSAPLFKYLKNTNVYSNNYLADAIFASLGGAEAFKNFQKNKLQLSNKELNIYTGSGLPLETGGKRFDNLGSCFSMIKVLSYLRQISEKAQMNLGHLLLNPTTDADGTFDSQSYYSNAVVLKTGRLYENPAMNLAGFVSTEKGMLSFVFLGHDFSSSEAKEIDERRTEMLDDIYRNYSTSSVFHTLSDYSIFF